METLIEGNDGDVVTNGVSITKAGVQMDITDGKIHCIHKAGGKVSVMNNGNADNSCDCTVSTKIEQFPVSTEIKQFL